MTVSGSTRLIEQHGMPAAVVERTAKTNAFAFHEQGRFFLPPNGFGFPECLPKCPKPVILEVANAKLRVVQTLLTD